MLLERDPLAAMLTLRASPLSKGLFLEQKTVLRLRGRWRGVVAGRRSGKSYLKAVWLLGGPAGKVSLYCARTLKSAKAIMLPVFAELNQRYGLGLRIRTAEGEIIEPNGHIIRFHGLKDMAAAELLRGQKFYKIALDEAGAFDDELLQFSIESILQPTLFDCRGQMTVSGSPGPICQGYYYELVGDPRGTGKVGRWPSHAWDLRSNPHLLGTPEENIADILAINGWTADNPTFRREVLAQWVDDAGSLIYHYKGERFAAVPASGRTIIAVDFAGSNNKHADDCAFLVGRQPHDMRPHVFLVEGFKRHGLTLTQIVATLHQLQAKWGSCEIVVDAGALGEGYRRTLVESFNIWAEGADKRDKKGRIENVVAALDTMTLHVCKEAESILTEWLSLAWDELRRTHHERCADDLSDTLQYLLGKFGMAPPPATVIRQITEADEVRRRAMHHNRRPALI